MLNFQCYVFFLGGGGGEKLFFFFVFFFLFFFFWGGGGEETFLRSWLIPTHILNEYRIKLDPLSETFLSSHNILHVVI